MPKVNDIKAYWREVASKAGLSEDEVKSVVGALDNEKVAKTFGESFKPLPDYSHDLDDVRARTKAQIEQQYAAWHAEEMKKYNEYVRVLDEHKKYTETFGALDNANPGSGLNPPPKTMTQEEIDRLVNERLDNVLNERLARRDAAYLSFRDADFDHMRRFNKPLDRKAFEEAWKSHQDWGGDLYIAYEKFIQPEVEKQTNAEWEKKLQAAREEGIRDGYSRRALPVDAAAKQFSPLFDRKEDVGKMDNLQQELHSREAFMSGLRETKT